MLAGMPARRLWSVILIATALVAAGCSGDDDDEPRGAGGGGSDATTVPRVFPLTGLAANDGNRANLTRRALVIKVENHPQARPQSGLDSADVVYEELVEGGQTRYLAVFHSTDADPVGPVRSVRPSDGDIIAPLRPLFGYSGGTPKFISQLRGTPGVTDVGVDSVPDAYPRRPGKRAPHNQYTSTNALYAKGPPGQAPPKFADFLDPGQPFAGAGAVAVTHLQLAIGSSTRVDYDWDAAGGVWKRVLDGAPHMAEGGGQLAPTNVVIQFTPYEASPGDFDVTGAQVSAVKVIGSGEAWFLSGGMLVKGRWSKADLSSPITYTDSAGAPIRLVPGRTWVELPAPGAPASTR